MDVELASTRERQSIDGHAGATTASTEQAATSRFPLCWPPSTESTTPVIQLARGDAANTTAFATSSALPSRPHGIDAWIASYIAGLPFLIISHTPPGNSIEPGAIMLTRIFAGASATASVFE